MIDDADDEREGMLAVMRMIYSQFICSNSDTEINVSYQVHAALQALFEQSDEAILNQLKTYDDFLSVFHWAIREAWNMCVSVYGFQFKSYVRKNRRKKDTESELSLSLVQHDNVKRSSIIKMDSSKQALPQIAENATTETSET